MSASDDRVYSPPERVEISFQDLLRGLIEKVTPSENGSLESLSSRLASPPLVISQNILFKNPLIFSNPIMNSFLLVSFNVSCFTFTYFSFSSSC